MGFRWEVLFIFADLRHDFKTDFCTIVSNEGFLFKIMFMRHAQPRKPKNEALLYSFIPNAVLPVLWCGRERRTFHWKAFSGTVCHGL
jgi:hypothetical protein